MAKRPTHTLSEAARLLRRHRHTVAGWVAAGLPATPVTAKRGPGQGWAIDLADAHDWLVARAVAAERERLEARHAEQVAALERELSVLRGDGEVSFEEARRRREQAQARLLELDVAEREGRLIPAVQLEEVLFTLSSAVVMRLRAVPVKAAPECGAARSDAERESILRQHIDEACNALADYLASGGVA